MLRTQKKVTNRKKPQSSPSTVSKSKGAKFDNNNDKVNSNAVHIIKNGKPDDVGPKKIQGHHNQAIDHGKAPSNTKVDHPSAAAPFKLGDKKLERSNSFFLTRKLSKLYDSLTHSRESLKGTNDTKSTAAAATNDSDQKTPFKFIRSVSLATISLKKDYRNSMRKPRLEQLSEEDHSINVPLSNAKRKMDRKKSSTASMDSLSSEKSSIISTFKRTFSLTPSRRKSSNPKWSASLMNLQQIDVMISYEDLSFIDYDKFNTYEENLMTKIKSSNQIDANRSNAAADQFPGVKMRSHPNAALQPQQHQKQQRRRHSTIVQRSSMQANDEYTTDNWLNGNSKRWSNPCIGPNTDCIGAFPFAPSDASRSVKVHPAINIDECDYGADKPQSIDVLWNSRNPAITAHSVDDLMNMANEHENNNGNPNDLELLQVVSRSNTIQCSFAHFALFSFCFVLFSNEITYLRFNPYLQVWVSV